jgi:hypothetical protein
MSELVTNKITPATGSSDTVTLGDSGDTFTIPAGVTLAGSGASLTALPAANLTGTAAVANGGTGVTAVGTSGNVLTSTGSAWASTAIPAGITLGTPVASTSGATIDFTGIPSGTKRIVVGWSGVSFSSSSQPLIQIGDAGGIETSGYLGGTCKIQGSTPLTDIQSDGLRFEAASASNIIHGTAVWNLLDSSTFTWSGVLNMSITSSNYWISGATVKSLSAELTQIRMTTTGGSDTFDAGKINIQYE